MSTVFTFSCHSNIKGSRWQAACGDGPLCGGMCMLIVTTGDTTLKVFVSAQSPRQQIEVSGQLQAPVAVLPSKQPPAQIS